MDKALTWFIRSWLVLVLLANIAAIVGFFLGAVTVWEGWMRVKETYSPFNISNFVMEMVVLSPALGALYWRDRRRGAESSRARRTTTHLCSAKIPFNLYICIVA